MLAIVSAMQEEISNVLTALESVTSVERGGRQFHRGTLCGVEVVAVFSRYGKVAAAATVTQLAATFPVDRLIFSGVAGAVSEELSIGDVVVASRLVQHDMDARPLFPRYEVPLLAVSMFVADPSLSSDLHAAASGFVSEDITDTVAPTDLSFFRIQRPRVLSGDIASGDKFFASSGEVADLRARLPSVVCVEMEGAAVAQVCFEYGIPFGILRVISDAANEGAPHDFARFTDQIASHYSLGILRRLLTV